MSRLDKINQQLKKEISLILRKELSDPRVECVSITHADVSPDLRSAKIYFTILGNAHGSEEIKEVLEVASGRIRKFVGRQMSMRYTPDLHFYYDDTIDASFNMDETLKEIADEHEKDHRIDSGKS